MTTSVGTMDKTRNLYFKYLMSSDIRTGLIYFVTELKEKELVVNLPIFMEFSTEENKVLENINTMKRIEQREDFFCWSNDPEFEEALRNAKIQDSRRN